MRLPLVWLLGPPLILLGAVAVFAGLHAWTETPRQERPDLPGAGAVERVSVETSDPDTRPQLGPAGLAEAAGRRVEPSAEDNRFLQVRWEVTTDGSPVADSGGLRCAVLSAERGTLLASCDLAAAGAGVECRAKASDELWAVVYAEGESPRHQYRQRQTLGDGDSEVLVRCELKTMSVRLTAPTVDRTTPAGRPQVAINIRRADDDRWGLAPAHGDVLEFGPEGTTDAYELRALGPGTYRVCADGVVCAEVEWPSDETVVIDL